MWHRSDLYLRLRLCSLRHVRIPSFGCLTVFSSRAARAGNRGFYRSEMERELNVDRRPECSALYVTQAKAVQF